VTTNATATIYMNGEDSATYNCLLDGDLCCRKRLLFRGEVGLAAVDGRRCCLRRLGGIPRCARFLQLKRAMPASWWPT
jgi:hypothetical protein